MSFLILEKSLTQPGELGPPQSSHPWFPKVISSLWNAFCRCSSVLSNHFTLSEGVKFNYVVTTVPTTVKFSLYFDDFALNIVGASLSFLEQQFQVVVENISQWNNSHSFHFLPSKTLAILFIEEPTIKTLKQPVIVHLTCYVTSHQKPRRLLQVSHFSTFDKSWTLVHTIWSSLPNSTSLILIPSKIRLSVFPRKLRNRCRYNETSRWKEYFICPSYFRFQTKYFLHWHQFSKKHLWILFTGLLRTVCSVLTSTFLCKNCCLPLMRKSTHLLYTCSFHWLVMFS